MPVCSYLIDILCTYEPVSVSALSNKLCTCIYIIYIYMCTYHMYMYRRNIGVGAHFFSGKVSWQVPFVKDMFAFKAWLCHICSPFRVRPPPNRCFFFKGNPPKNGNTISCFRIEFLRVHFKKSWFHHAGRWIGFYRSGIEYQRFTSGTEFLLLAVLGRHRFFF